MNIKPWQSSVWDISFPSDEIQVCSADLDVEESMQFLPLLSDEEKKRAERLKSSNTASRQIISRGILRLLLSKMVGSDPKDLVLAYGPSGKPYISFPQNTGFDFNLAHSDNLLLIAFIKEKRIGIDVEKIEEKIDFSGISSLVFSTEEQLALSRSLDPISDFYALWTAKEAVLKGFGLGFTYPSSQFSVDISKGIINLSMIPVELSGGCSCSLSSFIPARGYSAAVAVLQ